MTEKEKMLSQKLYDANYDAELIKERLIAKDLCHEYNRLRPSESEKQQGILRKLLGKTREEKKLYPAIQKDTRFPLSFKLDPDHEYCVFYHADRLRTSN